MRPEDIAAEHEEALRAKGVSVTRDGATLTIDMSTETVRRFTVGPEPRTVTVGVRLTLTERDALRSQAKALGCSMSDLLRMRSGTGQ